MSHGSHRISIIAALLLAGALAACDDEGTGATADAAAKDGQGIDRSISADTAADQNRDTNVPNCSNVGCGPPPTCGQSCQTACGCCHCAPGEIVTLSGRTYRCEGTCYSPVDAGAPDTPADATDAPADAAACPACASDEVCVQFNDSSAQCRSPTPTLACRKISSACRAELPLVSRTSRSCAAVSAACQAELCSLPYQCTTTPPCGNETAAAQAWCYGP